MSPSTYHVSLQECSVVRLAAKLWTCAAMIKKLTKTNLMQYKAMPPQLVNIVKMKVIDLSTLNAESKNKIQSLIKPVGDSLLAWIKGHYEFFESIQEALEFCSNLCWLPDGSIDNRATAEILLEYDAVDVSMKFVLACIYCFEQQILTLWDQLKQCGTLCIDEEIAFKYPLANYWLEFLKNKNFNSFETMNTKQLRRISRPPSITTEAKVDFPGDDEASESFHSDKERSIVESTSTTNISEDRSNIASFQKSQQLVPVGTNKKVVKLVDTKCFCQKVIMCPQDNLMDVLLNYAIQAAIGNEPWTNLGFKYGGFVQFLFSLANIRQRINKLELNYDSSVQAIFRPPTCFLEWPLQWFFLDIVTDKWVFSTIEMCQIQFGKIIAMLRLASKEDYRDIFLQIWNSTTISQWTMKMHATSADGLEKLCGIMPWDLPQSENIIPVKMSDDASNNVNKRSKSVAMSKLYSSIQQLMVIQKLDFIQELIDNCLPPTDQFSQSWKSEFMFSYDGIKTVASLIHRRKWEAIETLLTWSLPTPEQIHEFNQFFITSIEGCKLCMDFVAHDDWDALKDVLNKSLTSEEDMKRNIKNKVDLFFDYAADDNWKSVEKNLMWCLFDAQDIKEFKIHFFERCAQSEIWNNPNLRAKETCEDIFKRLLEAKGPEYYQETLLITFILLFLVSAIYFLR